MQRQRRAAIFIQDLRGGGAERMMVNLANGMASRNLAVDLVLAEATGPYVELVDPAVRMVDLRAKRVAASPWALAGYLRRERPDALLSALLHVNVAALIARRLAPAGRLVISERNTVSVDLTNIGSRSIRLARWLARHLYARADGIIAVSQGVADDLVAFFGLPPERVCVINNPVVTPYLLRQAAAPLADAWFRDSDRPVILGIGKLWPQKDFGTLIAAFARLRQRRPARLAILGEGAERPRLAALVRELGLDGDVALPGFVDNPYACMARASLFALSSRWEGSPNVLVEAMACGTPVVSTDCPSGPGEILEGGRYGPLVPIGDAERLADAMARLLDRPTPTQALKARAADYSVERATTGYLDVLFPDGYESR